MLMNRRRFLQLGAIGAAGASLGACANATRSATSPAPQDRGSRPNFIVIITDDQGYQDVGCYGSPDIRTPNLDRMAAEGVRFTDFYVAAPLCSPSRAALMTGCYPQRVSITSVLHPHSKIGLNPGEITIADMLKTRGYATACIGKWHLGHLPPFFPTRQGFDYYFGLLYSNDMFVNRDTNERGIPLMRGEEVIENPVVQETLTPRYTEEAVRFITDNKDRPFFLYVPHTAPHVPLHVSQRFAGRSKRGTYGDVIEEIDWSTGEILNALKRLGLDQNTLVTFTSDNGPWLAKGKDGGSALPLRDGKGTAWEGGMRVPAIMRWPGRIPSGSLCKEMALTIDLLPTLAGLAGVEPPSDRIIDGKDIWPLISSMPHARTPHEAFFYYEGAGLCAVRSGKWKLIIPRKRTQRRSDGSAKETDVPLSLCDLNVDISETNDVSANHPAVVKRLLDLAERCRDDIGDSLQQREGKNVRPPGTSEG